LYRVVRGRREIGERDINSLDEKSEMLDLDQSAKQLHSILNFVRIFWPLIDYGLRIGAEVEIQG